METVNGKIFLQTLSSPSPVKEAPSQYRSFTLFQLKKSATPYREYSGQDSSGKKKAEAAKGRINSLNCQVQE